VSYGGGDGTSCEAAVVIHGARNENDGVAAEYAWLKQHHPKAAVQGQALTECQGHPADSLRILGSDGQTREVFFDVNEYFGKF
jgi:hypothetical protein